MKEVTHTTKAPVSQNVNGAEPLDITIALCAVGEMGLSDGGGSVL